MVFKREDIYIFIYKYIFIIGRFDRVKEEMYLKIYLIVSRFVVKN